MLLELASVVREDVLERNGEHHLTEAEKLLGSFGSMGCRGPGEGETTVDILERDNVAPAAVDEAFNGIKGNAVTGVSGPEVLGLAQHPLPVGSHTFPRMRQNLLREDAQPSQISDEPAHGGDGGDWKCLPPAVSSQKDLQLLFSKIGMLHPESLDLVEHLKWPRTDAVLHGYLRTFIQSFRFPSAFPQSLLPEKKRWPLHTEGIHRGFKTVLLPENENCKLLLGFVCHMLPPYRSVVTGYEVKAFECRLEASSTHRSLLTQGVQYVSEPMHPSIIGEAVLFSSLRPSCHHKHVIPSVPPAVQARGGTYRGTTCYAMVPPGCAPAAALRALAGKQDKLCAHYDKYIRI